MFRGIAKIALLSAVFGLVSCGEEKLTKLDAPKNSPATKNIVVEPVKNLSDDFMRGVDISMLSDIEKNGGKYFDANGKESDLFKILKESGVNWVRLRVWNNPKNGGGSNSVDVDIPLAKRAKKAGLKLLVDFHYSDSWADPAKQFMPEDWKNLSQKELEDAVENFTRDSIQKFIKAGATPDAVQIGNELNNGFMWPMGQLWSEDSNVKIGGIDAFISLLNRASKGVRSVKNGDKIQIVIHLADGGDQNLYKWIFDDVTKANIDYDIIGLSFYTYWHGNVSLLKDNLEMLSKRYGKKMAVVETAYAFTEKDGDEQGNVFKVYSDELGGYLPSVQGQATAIRDVFEAVASVDGGCGVFYWEPAWIPVKNAGLSLTEGDTWENQCLFDFDGRVLPSLNVFGLVKGENAVKNVWGGSATNGSKKLPYKMAEPVEIKTKPNTIPVLPSSVKVFNEDDSESLVNVKWEEKDWSSVKFDGSDLEVSVSGSISGTDFKPTATVIFTNVLNLVSDASFESGNLGKWKLDGNPKACFVENNKGNAHTGKFTYKYWLDSGFKSVLSQEFNNLENGTYELSIWSMGGGGENDIQFFADSFNSENERVSAKITNTGWQNWEQYKIQVSVSNGKINVGILLDTNPGCWGNFDDVVLKKID